MSIVIATTVIGKGKVPCRTHSYCIALFNSLRYLWGNELHRKNSPFFGSATLGTTAVRMGGRELKHVSQKKEETSLTALIIQRTISFFFFAKYPASVYVKKRPLLQ